MRIRPVVVLLLGASSAWAQPADQPAEPAPASPTEPATPSPSTEPPPEGTPPASSPLEPKPAPPVVAPATQPPHSEVEPPSSAPRIKDDPDNGFRFGSYGRISAGDDLRGGKPEEIAIVAHAPRIVEPTYLELDTSYGFTTEQGLKLRPVITLAFDGTLFHDTGEFDAHPALRNMYLDAQISHELSAWAGSRMYRGDDIYLLDYWPLDDQNIVGAGLFLHHTALEAMGQRLFETGGSGTGHAMKALNNFLAGTNFLAAAEALVVGKRFGLEPSLMVEIINQSTGRNFSTEHVLPQHVLSRKFASGFQLGLLAKDVKIAADLADDLQAEAPVARLSRDLLALARDRLGATADHSAAIQYWELLNGVTVGGEPEK